MAGSGHSGNEQTTLPVAAAVSAMRSRFQDRARAVVEVAKLPSCGLPSIADSLSFPCALFCYAREQE